jgi:hypothetical protein
MQRRVEANQLDAALYSFVDQQLFQNLIEKAELSDMDDILAAAEARSPAVNYVASRVFHKLIYRTLLKRERRMRSRRNHGSKLT